MTTTVAFRFVLPDGTPVANSDFEVQLSTAGYNDDEPGVALPRPIVATTDVNGEATLELWPNDALYYVTVLDTQSEAGLSYKFQVPVVAPGTTLQMQDLILNLPPAGTTYDAATLAAIQTAKAETLSAKAEALAAAATATAAAATVVDVSVDAAAAATAAGNAQTAATGAAASQTAAATSATNANNSAVAAAASQASAVASASSATASATAAGTSQTTASTAATTATTKATEAAISAAAALVSQNAASASATTASTQAGNASTSATAAAGSASAAVAALDAFTDIYLGAFASAPALDNDGNALAVGALYFKTGASQGLYTWNGSGWVATFSTGSVDSVAGRTGAVVLTKADVGLGNVDNTTDANKPISTATQTALDAKQATLVSATNIKTLNGASLLGAGDIAIAAGVSTFNTRAGAVTLTAADVTTALGATAVANATAAASAATATKLTTPRAINGVPFDGTAAIAIASDVTSVAGRSGAVVLTKSDVGLANVDNTTDAGKPISTATQTALDTKVAGPASAVSGNVASFNGTTGKIVQDSGKAIPAGVLVGTTDAQTLTNKTLTNPSITNYTEGVTGGGGSTYSVDLANGTVHLIAVSANCTITLPASVAGKSYVLILSYSGVYTVSFTGGSTIKWPGGIAPTPTSVNAKKDIYVFTCDGTNTYGRSSGANF